MRAIKSMRVAAIIVVMLAPSPLRADITVRQYFIWSNGSDPEFQHIMAWYFAGIVRGMEYSNKEIIARNHKPLFCGPIGWTNNIDLYSRILQHYLTSGDERRADLTTADALLRALKEKFPCQ
jgi:hypothetical protein